MFTASQKNESAELLTPRQFWEAKQGRIGLNTVYELLQVGKIKHLRIGRKILIPRSELEDFVTREVHQ